MCSIMKPPAMLSAAAGNTTCSSEFGFSSAWTPDIFERYINSEFTFSPAWSTKIFERYYLCNEKDDKSASERVVSDPQPLFLNGLKETATPLSANLSGSPVSNSSNTTPNVGVYTFEFGMLSEARPNDITRLQKPDVSGRTSSTLSHLMSTEKSLEPTIPASPFKFGLSTSNPLTALTATPTPTHASSPWDTNSSPLDKSIECNPPTTFKFGTGVTPPLTLFPISSTTTPSISQSVAPTPATTFKFGAPKLATSPSTFSFSSPKLPVTTTPQPVLDSSSATSNSLFGSFKPAASSPALTSTTPAATANTVPVGRVFGTGNFQPASQSITGSGFVFGVNPQPANTTDSHKPISTGGFNFGGVSTNINKPTTFPFGVSQQAPGSGLPSVTPNPYTFLPTTPTTSAFGEKPGFSFGSSNPSTPTPNPFGQVQSPPLSTPMAQSTPMFQFGGTGTSSSTSFPSASVPTTNFNFGFGNHASGSNITFGSLAQPTPGMQSPQSPAPPLFNFGGNNPSTATSFGLFGQAQSSHLNPTSAPVFQFGGTGTETSSVKKMKLGSTTPQAFPSPPLGTVPPLFNFSATPSTSNSFGRKIKKAHRRLKK